MEHLYPPTKVAPMLRCLCWLFIAKELGQTAIRNSLKRRYGAEWRYDLGYGLPSLCTNRPSALELVISISEQVVRSCGLREPTSR